MLGAISRAILGRTLAPRLSLTLRRGWHFGLAHYCPCCQAHVRSFGRGGRQPRANAVCPVCGAYERHRLTCLYMLQETDLLARTAPRVLHIAPEKPVAQVFRRLNNIDYLSADLSGYAMVNMDIMDIQFPDDSFDIIYCSHVLEHVARDEVALAELHRVLKPGGWAILQVPLEGYYGRPVIDVTVEDPAIADPRQRTEWYGQDDHVRRYGRDYADRLAAAGFAVNVEAFARRLTPRDRLRLGIMEEDIYFCTKRPPQTAAGARDCVGAPPSPCEEEG